MKILAILQNQWFKNPDKVREIYARHSELDARAKLNARFLFAGCLSGTRLKDALGDLCNSIIWEEAAAMTGSKSSACPPADPRHIIKVIKYHKPDIVITFGAIATNGLMETMGAWQFLEPGSERCEFKVLTCCHPAARKNVNIRLAGLAHDLRSYIQSAEVAA